LRYDDPSLGICWPLPVNDISEKDASHLLVEKQQNLFGRGK